MLFIKKPRKLVVLSLLVSVALALTLELGTRTQPINATGADKVAALGSDQGQGQVVEAGFWTFIKRVAKCTNCLYHTAPNNWDPGCAGDSSCGGSWW